MPTLPIWATNKIYGEDAGNAAFSRVGAASVDLPEGYKMTVSDIIVESETPVGWQKFYLLLLDGDGTTILETYGPIQFWVDGFEHVNPLGLVFMGGKDNQDRDRKVELWAVESSGALVERTGTVLFRIEAA